MSEIKLNFEDTATAFSDKSTTELQKKYQLFRLVNSPFLTGIGTKMTELAFNLHLPIKYLVKKTIFAQFCGGETIEECELTINKLGKSHIGTILDYSVEGKSTEESFEATKTEIHRTLTRAKKDEDVPFTVFKVTGIAPFEILEKISAGKELFKNEQTAWDKAQARVAEICEYAHSIEQPVFIDAEESWVQNAIDALADEMMEKYNREKPLIYNTLQLYRHDRLEFLKKSHRRAANGGYILAVKLVRGAYMEKERARAAEKGYSSPIQLDKKATDGDFDRAIEYSLEHINNIALVAGTHNEESVKKITLMLEAKGIEPNHPHVFFSQLYGMSDNLSYVLAKNNFNVSKYLPYGAVKDVMPYLIRRAHENTAVMGQVSRELDLIGKELKRRKAQ